MPSEDKVQEFYNQQRVKERRELICEAVLLASEKDLEDLWSQIDDFVMAILEDLEYK